MKALLAPLFALALVLATPGAARAGEPEHLLDGTSFRYFTQSGWGLEMSFVAGTVTYRWIAGPPAGNANSGIPYRSRQLAPETYLVAFHDPDPDGSDYVTLVLDFAHRSMASSALLRYDTERPRIQFEGGVIEAVRGRP